ncbi:hypothetical protein V5O39_03025 [Pseudomonas parakoreensis]
MSITKNFVAVDWRTGPDRIYFFFPEKNSYSRFDFEDNKVLSGFPKPVDGKWKASTRLLQTCALALPRRPPTGTVASTRSGCSTTKEQHPAFASTANKPTRQSRKPPSPNQSGKNIALLRKIVGVMWAESTAQRESYWFLLNDGNYLIYEIYSKTLELLPLKGSPWAPLEEYKNQMMTAVTNDYPTFDTYFYVFLNDNRYLRYEQNAKKYLARIQSPTRPGRTAEGLSHSQAPVNRRRVAIRHRAGRLIIG